MLFALGLIVGIFLGIGLMCILFISRDADVRAEYMRKDLEKKDKDE
jgi:F0F1-type ATP synthase assembly protein I